MDPESGHSLAGYSPQAGLISRKKSVGWAVFSVGGSTGEEYTSAFIHIVGRIHFLEAM